MCAALIVGSVGVSCGTKTVARQAEPLPRVMLWAWHGSHDLRFLTPAEAGIAFLAGTVRVSGSAVTLEPGAGPIEAPKGAVLLPVIRIEVDATRRPVLGPRQLEDVTAAVLGFDADPFPGLQLDFDATRSQRAFYGDLLGNVRRGLGGRFLSVAALPSWCLGDPWLPIALVDEIVPMVYSMGIDSERIRRMLAAGRDFRAECREAVGLSRDEPVALPARDRRCYLWSREPWTRAGYEAFGNCRVGVESGSKGT